MIANLLNGCNSISLISDDTDKETFQRQDENGKQNVHIYRVKYRLASESFLYSTIDAARRSALSKLCQKDPKVWRGGEG